MNVLFAYDGSESAEAALLDIPRAGLPAGSTIHVLTVDEPSAPLINFDITSLTHHHQRGIDPLRIARMAEERLELAMPDAHVEVESSTGAAADTITGVADLEKVDLIVIGSGGDGPLARLHLGSTTSRVVHRSHRAVRVARNAHPDHRKGPVRIIVGIDGSPASRAAARTVRARNFPLGTEIWIVTALEGGMSEAEHVEDEKRAAALHRLYAAELESPATTVHSVIRTGDAIGILLSLVSEVDADVIFVGTSGEGGIFSKLFGTTTSIVAERADCSVEVVWPIVAR